MIQLHSIFIASLAVTVSFAVPLQKRITQTIADSTTDWVAACTTAGGAGQCGTISQQAFMTLLAAGGNCDQQNAADAMVNLAKQLNSNSEMIRLAQLFVQQPRNAPDSLQVPYCQTAPNNTELAGLFHCQFASSDFTKFSGDQTVNVPLGLQSVNPPGSCPAKTDGPVPDGVQLNTLVQSPGDPEIATGTNATLHAPASNVTAAPTRRVAADAQPFTLQNGIEAQSLNAQFASLTISSPCTDGTQACVDGEFAQCVGGVFVATACAGGTQCFALPLVDKAGTSIACSTETDASTRLAATGATGGLTGTGGAASPTPSAPARRQAAQSFTLQNGLDAQKLNAQFASLTATSPCTDGTQACAGGEFAQCVGGVLEATACAAATQCFALPLVNKAGTSITCSTEADAETRIAATGATGGITGA